MIISNTKSLIFPPYIKDLESRDYKEEDWAEAINAWNTNLSLLLKLRDAAFHDQMLHNDSLRRFLGTFLGTHARSRNVKYQYYHEKEIELEKKVLAVLLRTSESKISTGQSENLTTLTESLYREDVISIPFLLDLVTTYGKSNFTHTKKILDNIIDSVPGLMQDFEFHSTMVINYIKAIKEKFKELIQSEDVEFDSDVKIYLSYILDIYITLDCLFTVFKPVVNIFNNFDDDDFLMTIRTFYDEIIPSILSLFNPENELDNLNILKHVLVSLASHVLDACYFSPLGFASSEDDTFSFIKSGEKLENDDRVKETLARMNEVLLCMIQSSPLDKPVQCFVDAPLLLDMEIEFDLNRKLTKIKNEICDGDDAQVDYIIKSLESMRIMIQETGKAPWRMRLKQKQKRYLSRMPTDLNGQKTNTLDSISPTVEVKANGNNDNETILISLISQVQEVFPDLGEGFIEACLSTYDSNVETVIDRILTQSLSDYLASLDHALSRQKMMVKQQNADDLLAQRRNIFDDDEFDVFSGKILDSSRIHKGKINRGTADELLGDKSFIETHKESMMNIIHNIMYEDEYDDTYDTSGLNMRGIDLHMVDELDGSDTNTHDKTEIDPGIMHEEKLIKMYQSDPSIFDRTHAVRKSDKRIQLRKITKMTDEQIEGWYIMFQRNPRKDKLLAKYEWKGNQKELFSNLSDDESPSQQSNYNQFRSGSRGRGEGRGVRRGRGTYSTRDKGSHNRKSAHTRKIGRGFGR